jgi:hypothetical protein
MPYAKRNLSPVAAAAFLVISAGAYVFRGFSMGLRAKKTATVTAGRRPDN